MPKNRPRGLRAKESRAVLLATQFFQVGKRAHHKKSKKQEAALQAEWESDPNFDKSRIEQIADKLGLLPMQVYKWVWDRNKGYPAVRALAEQLIAVHEAEINATQRT